MSEIYRPGRMKFGAFIAPYHTLHDNPTVAMRRDIQLIELLDQLDFDEAWVGEHHSAGSEIISCPEMLIAAAAERTRRIRMGTGVNSLCYHNPLILADRIVQLDHQTQGRIMFGAGPGQLASDAAMLGIDPIELRRMMVESLECIVELFEGKAVTRQTDWFNLVDAKLQLLPYQRPRMEVGVAAAVTPSGPVLAGRLGLSMISMAASTVAGFDALPGHWTIFEKAAAEHGQRVSRESWRVIAPMHIAPTREQAWAEAKDGVFDLIRYFQGLVGAAIPALFEITNADDALAYWMKEGLVTFGVLTAGTPDDAIDFIERLQVQSGGFGTFLLLAHNGASWQATQNSYELFARYVAPHFQGSNEPRMDSLRRFAKNAPELLSRTHEGQQRATDDYEAAQQREGAKVGS